MRTNPLPIITEKVEERFWAAVTQSDSCWLWNKCKDRDGYGLLNVDRKLYRSHRLAAQIAGMVIPPGHFVCHSCDVRGCCNPSHLFVGSARDNTRDMYKKKREARGERHGISPLKNTDVVEMRNRSAAGESYASLGRHFKISDVAVGNIVRRKTWCHIE